PSGTPPAGARRARAAPTPPAARPIWATGSCMVAQSGCGEASADISDGPAVQVHWPCHPRDRKMSVTAKASDTEGRIRVVSCGILRVRRPPRAGTLAPAVTDDLGRVGFATVAQRHAVRGCPAP